VSGWLRTGDFCKHCLEPLEVRPATARGDIVIKGCEPMEYRHASDGNRLCYVTFQAAPYSNWGIYDSWRTRLGEIAAEEEGKK
jgi:hypothetical protein